ncbi:MAG: helix-turn-helix transcriptional regulator [Erysipelotrichaceae bacterium]|nr:helix-turn-helix transcriptional regulator [Erysipelotrichaceae bacterium]
MMVSYNKLWKLLIDKKMNKKDLIQVSGISTASVSKLVKGQNIQTDVLCKICKTLNCDFCDIMEYVRDE